MASADRATHHRPLAQVLVKPAGADCNLRCGYCFYLSRASLYGSKPRMSAEVLDRLCRQLAEGGADTLSYCWQGGEPTLMGIDFFKRVLAAQAHHARPAQQCTNSLQTNGLALDDEWCQLLAGRFLVGLSIDGPAELHDRWRLTSNDRPSHAHVVRALGLLRAHRVDVNALVVLSSASVGRAREIWQSLGELGCDYLQFIPCLEPHPTEPGRWAPYSLVPEALGELLCELFDLWVGAFRGGAPTVFVRWFEALLFGYVGLEVPLCTLRPSCEDAIVVEHNGDVFACDFYVTERWRLGNLRDGHLQELAHSAAALRFGARKSELPDRCRACPWLDRCWGGCPKDRDRALDGTGVDPYCVAYQRFFAHADPTLKRIAGDWRRSRAPVVAD